MAARRLMLTQARATLMTMRPHIEEIQPIRQLVLKWEPDLCPPMRCAARGGGSGEPSKLANEFAGLGFLVQETLASGIESNDRPAGLIEYRAWCQDRDVYLCWKLGK